MLKTALKHYIYEICIDTLFIGFSKNFRKGNRLNLRVGQNIKHIIENKPYGVLAEYFDVTVTDVYKHRDNEYINIDYQLAYFYAKSPWSGENDGVRREPSDVYFKKKFEGKGEEHNVWQLTPYEGCDSRSWSHLDVYNIEIYD